MISKFIIVFTLLTGSISQSYAHPVAYAGSSSIMTWNSREMSDWMLTHSFTSKYSLSARTQRINTIEGERRFYIPHLNFLAKRWNELDSQANIYLSAGLGGEVQNRSFKNTTLAALEADWESRKYYVSFRHEALLSFKKDRRDIYATKVRAGFAPYLAEFNELSSWFILEAEKVNRSSESYELTPMVRLFYRNVLTEFGVNQNGEAKFNFMIHF